MKAASSLEGNGTFMVTVYFWPDKFLLDLLKCERGLQPPS